MLPSDTGDGEAARGPGRPSFIFRRYVLPGECYIGSRCLSPSYSLLQLNCRNEFIDKLNETVYPALNSSRRLITARRKDFQFTSHLILFISLTN